MAFNAASTVESRSILEQVVLLGVTELHRADETPVQSPAIRRYCNRELPTDETAIIGTLGEADVVRSLYRLADENLVDEIEAGRKSPTGKGRPAYTLAVDVKTVYEGVDDELLEE